MGVKVVRTEIVVPYMRRVKTKVGTRTCASHFGGGGGLASNVYRFSNIKSVEFVAPNIVFLLCFTLHSSKRLTLPYKFTLIVACYLVL
jgi:hypothetical protein